MKTFKQLMTVCGIRPLFEVLSAITKGEKAVAELCVQRETDRANSPLQYVATCFNRARERQEHYDRARNSNNLYVYYAMDVESELAKIYADHTKVSRLINTVGYPSLDLAEQFCPMRTPDVRNVTGLRVCVDLSEVGGWNAICEYRDNSNELAHVVHATRLESCVIDLTLLVRRPSGELEEVPIPFKDPVIM